ncbi:MAG: hypothetical protein ABIQ08_16855 [Duganella sp.]
MSTLHFPIRVPSELLEALGEHTGIFWSDSLGLEPFICEAIRGYMKPPPAAEQRPSAPSEAGYQWKQVFLPDGTRLRASFGGKSYFAVVEGAEIRHGDRPMSPSRFANLQGGGNRNAWKAIWLRLPGGDEWLLADVCRGARKAAIARLFGAPADSHEADAPRPRRHSPPSSGKRPASQRTDAGAAGREPSRVAPQSAARPTTGRAPATAAVSGVGNGVERKAHVGKTHAARGKRRGKKHNSGNP